MCILLAIANGKLWGKINSDSLLRSTTNMQLSDSLRVDALVRLSIFYKDSDLPKSLSISRHALDLADSTGSPYLIASAQDNHATILKFKGDYHAAEEMYLSAKKIAEELGDTLLMTNVYGHLGTYYQAVEQNQLAIFYLLRSLNMDQERGEDGRNSVAATLNNIGNVYYSDRNHEQALFYYRSALHLNKLSHNQKFESINYLNIGNTLKDMKQADSALWYYRESIRIAKEKNIIWVIAASKEGSGNCLIKLGKPDEAMAEFREGLEAAYSFGNKELIYYLNAGLADAYLGIGELDSARQLYQICVDTATYYQFSFLLSQVYLVGAKIYEASGDYKSANKLYLDYAQLRDSLAYHQNAVIYRNFEERLRQEEKDHAEELEQKTKHEQAEAENRRNKIVLVFTVIVLLLSISLGLFAFRSYRLKKKSHERLGQQKDIIEEKNREILSSISYAQRLQQAILPSDKSWSGVFPSSFIFYQPKDIVAGDFYWMEKSSDVILFAAADCTGHGVPGALVSVVCSNALNRAVNEFKLKSPGSILDKVSELVVETFEKSGSTVYDGMDISLCAFATSTRTLTWSGANLPLWIVSPSDSGPVLTEIKADKQPIGKFDLRKPFTTHSIQLNCGDTVFLFTDGYADQFGGPSGKKFKYKPMQEILLKNSQIATPEQRSALVAAFNTWRGNLEQVDDVCVIGIRI